LEIGWDGGVTDQNISQLAFAGVDVFNVGGFIQKAEDPEKAFHVLERIADETGTT
jgi:pentose-5-phosphate-3-epimerase